jgi:pimeloyl-ACP methyl ester carboxylesterase
MKVNSPFGYNNKVIGKGGVILVYIVLGIGFVLLVAYVCYWVAFYHPVRRHGDPVPMPRSWRSEQVGPKLRKLCDEMSALPCERVEIKSHDGLRLVGYYYHEHDGAMLHLQFHGYRGSGARDMCGLHKIAREMGHNTLVVWQRSAGESDGQTITFGIQERRDCVAWARYAANRFGEDIPMVLAGVSMGAATVMMASELDLPDNVIGIVADCGYSSPREIICKVSRDVRVPCWVSYPFVLLGALIFGRFMLWQSSAVSAVRNSKVPVLLLHGEDDHYVPPEMSEMILAASRGKARLYTFPGAGHGVSYVTDPVRYQRLVQTFLTDCRKQWERHRNNSAT